MKKKFANIRIFETEEAKISEISLPIIVLGIFPINHPLIMANFGGFAVFFYWKHV
jgi:hypothetical protein